MASICIDSMLNELKLLDSHPNRNSMRDMHLARVKLELGLRRTFCMCARKWSKHDASLSSFLSSLEDSVQNSGQYLSNSLNFPRLEDEEESFSEYFTKRISELREKIKSCKEEISKFYVKFRDFMLQHASSNFNSGYAVVRDEFMEFLDSLLENPLDFVCWGEAHISPLHEIESLEEKLRFLKNFICFAELRGVGHTEVEKLLIHCEAVAVISAQFLHEFWYEEIYWEEICEILKKIKPVDPQVRKIYIHVLMDSKSLEMSLSYCGGR